MDRLIEIKKRCCTCKTLKLRDEFNKLHSSKDGLDHTCKACKKEYNKRTKKERSKKRKALYKKDKKRILKEQKEYYKNNREKRLAYQKEYQSKRKEDKKTYDKIYYMKNKTKISKRGKIYYLDNKEKIDSKAKEFAKNNPKRVSDTKRYGIYGITGEQYETMFKEQEGRCKICKIHQDEVKRKLSVDHIHGTDPIKIRGLLCDNCNHALGKLKDSPEIILNAYKYVKKFGKIK